MAHGHGAIDAVGDIFAEERSVKRVAEAGFGVQEGVMLVDVERLVVVAAGIVVELVVDAVGLIADVAHLHIAEDVPMAVQMSQCLDEDVAVQLMGVRVVVLVVDVEVCGSAVNLRVCHPDEPLLHYRMGRIGEVAEVVAVEVLHAESADDVPQLVLVVGTGHEAVGVLRQSLLTHEVGAFDVVAVQVLHAQSELRQFVVRTELLVVAVAVGVVQRGRSAPVVVDGPDR